MKIALLSLFSLFGAVTLFTSCKLDAPDLPPNITLNKNTLDTYQPLSENSYWKYAVDFPSNGFYEVSMTSKTKTLNNKTYNIANNKYSDGNTAEIYYNVTNHTYSMRQQNALAGDLYFTYLVDNANIGYTWTESITESGAVNGAPGRIIGKIAEKGITKSVSNKTYKNVIHTTVQLQYALLSTNFDTWATYQFYVAKGIGIIEIDSDVFGVPSSTILTAYTIK